MELGGDEVLGRLNPSEFQCLWTHVMTYAAAVAVLMGVMMGCRDFISEFLLS